MPSPAAGAGTETGRLRARFWLLAAVLVPINAYWIIVSEVVRYAGHPTTISLFTTLFSG
jgi:hypothetical protein